MKNTNQETSIETLRVFSENNQVFKKEGTEDWHVIPFQWTSVNFNKQS